MSDLWIKTKLKTVVPFDANEVQIKHLENLGWSPGMRLEGVRDLILKARQFGFSTLIEALLFLDTINNPNTNTVVIAHDLDSTVKLFRMVDQFYRRLPSGKPETQFASKREIYWPSLNSRISVETAGKGTAGRADTINNIHISEWAFWEDDEVVTGLLQSVPKGGNIFAESTANGRGNQFHIEYQLATGKLEQAEDGRAGSVFDASFYPWYWHPEYSEAAPDDFDPTEEECGLVKQFGLTDGQLQWRRSKMLEPGMGAKFVQEYPSTDDEAFRVTGSLLFPDFRPDGEDAHVVPAVFTPDRRPPSWYEYTGGVDWGYSDPWFAALTATDENSNIWGLESDEEPFLTDDEQADRLVRMLARWGIPIKKCRWLAGEDIWATRHVNGVQVEPIVLTYQRAGLVMVRAQNDAASQINRNSLVRNRLKEVRRVRIQQGYNRHLVEAMSNAKFDPHKREQCLHDRSSHGVFAFACALSSWAHTPEAPPPPMTEAEKFAKLRESVAAEQLRKQNGRLGLQLVERDGQKVWQSRDRSKDGFDGV